MGLELFLSAADGASLAREHEAHWKKGRAFVPGAHGLVLDAAVTLVVAHPESGEVLRIDATVVWVKDDGAGAGVGLAFRDWDEPRRALLAELVGAPGAESPAEAGADAAPGEDDGDELAEGARGAARNLFDRIRRLSVHEQQQLARQGGLPERTALERVCGSSVWEGLLQNPGLTAVEVSRLAKKGNLPGPLVGTIVGNGAWLSSAEVQRALLGNPRLSGALLGKVLRALPAADLARVPQQTAYRPAVRLAARQLLGKG